MGTGVFTAPFLLIPPPEPPITNHPLTNRCPLPTVGPRLCMYPSNLSTNLPVAKLNWARTHSDPDQPSESRSANSNGRSIRSTDQLYIYLELIPRLLKNQTKSDIIADRVDAAIAESGNFCISGFAFKGPGPNYFWKTIDDRRESWKADECEWKDVNNDR